MNMDTNIHTYKWVGVNMRWFLKTAALPQLNEAAKKKAVL